ncbi:MAG TPA: hypothetical protein VGN16_03245 [Acidobacteriaceae bacterium]|jgi:hypothetical protein
MVAIRKAVLAAHHLSSGRTRHTISDSKGTRSFPPFTELVIAKDPGESGYFLMHHCSDGSAADTFHLTLEDAMYQAEWELDVKPEEWTVIDEPYGA